MYTNIKNSKNLQNVFTTYKTKIFNNKKTLIILNNSDFIFNDSEQLRKFKNLIFIFEGEPTFYNILKSLEAFTKIIVFEKKFSLFEDEFIKQVCEINKYEILNFEF